METHGTAAYTLGQYNEVLVALARALPKALVGTDAKKVIAATQNGEALETALAGTLRLLVDGKGPFNLYPIVVDYGMKVEEAVKLGNYDWVLSDITQENFPTQKKGKTELVVELIRFDHCISTDQALKELDRMGYRPAELMELLAFGEKYPEVQREFSIAALGSVWQNPDGDRRVPFFCSYASKHGLNLFLIENDWGGGWRFAAVRK